MATELYFDGWYTDKEDALAVGKLIESNGAEFVGLVEGVTGFGALYWSAIELFPNHVIDPMTNPSIVRKL
jgi:hypothetical protein